MAMDMGEEMLGEAAPFTNNGHLFCLSYRLKGVCNSNCGRRHMNRHLSYREHGILEARKSQLCGTNPPPVLEVYMEPLEYMKISTRGNRSQGR